MSLLFFPYILYFRRIQRKQWEPYFRIFLGFWKFHVEWQALQNKTTLRQLRTPIMHTLLFYIKEKQMASVLCNNMHIIFIALIIKHQTRNGSAYFEFYLYFHRRIKNNNQRNIIYGKSLLNFLNITNFIHEVFWFIFFSE